MPLKINDVAVVMVALALEEVVEPDFIQRGRRCIGRNMTANPVVELVGPDHHRERVPPNEALDAALNLSTARKRWLFRNGDGVDIRGVRREGELDAATPGVVLEKSEQAADPGRPARLEHVVERLEPLARLE